MNRAYLRLKREVQLWTQLEVNRWWADTDCHGVLGARFSLTHLAKVRARGADSDSRKQKRVVSPCWSIVQSVAWTPSDAKLDFEQLGMPGYEWVQIQWLKGKQFPRGGGCWSMNGDFMQDYAVCHMG